MTWSFDLVSIDLVFLLKFSIYSKTMTVTWVSISRKYKKYVNILKRMSHYENQFGNYNWQQWVTSPKWALYYCMLQLHTTTGHNAGPLLSLSLHYCFSSILSFNFVTLNSVGLFWKTYVNILLCMQLSIITTRCWSSKYYYCHKKKNHYSYRFWPI